jgi:hypothetical protein
MIAEGKAVSWDKPKDRAWFDSKFLQFYFIRLCGILKGNGLDILFDIHLN